jgi:hypothetical protein
MRVMTKRMIIVSCGKDSATIERLYLFAKEWLPSYHGSTASMPSQSKTKDRQFQQSK